MLLFEVCAFDESFNKKNNITIDKECTKHFKSLTSFLQGKTKIEKLSEEARDILYLIEDELSFLFTSALLFINIDKEIISEYVGVSPKAIKCFQEIFFRVHTIKGKIGKIGFFKKLIASTDKNKQTLGVTLKAAHTFGFEYIKWKFGLIELSTDTERIIDSTFKDMYFKYMEKSFKMSDAEVLEHIKAGKQLISAATDIHRAYATSGSTVDDIKQYLVQLQESGDEQFIEVEQFDVDEINNAIESKETVSKE